MAKKKVKKLTKAEFEKVNDIRKRTEALDAELLALSKFELQIIDRKNIALDFSKNLQEDDKALARELSSKYGDVSVDLDTGEIREPQKK
jgi:spore coat polysaccharide biosynthesis predicted glycosyltransferase SpsG